VSVPPRVVYPSWYHTAWRKQEPKNVIRTLIPIVHTLLHALRFFLHSVTFIIEAARTNFVLEEQSLLL